MKKLALLTSVLVLAACGAGSDGPGDRFKIRSSSRYFYVKDKAAESNADITTMKSEVALCHGNCKEITQKITGTPSHPSMFSRKSTEQQGENVLTIYNLGDTEFVIDENTKFSFVVDDAENSELRGKITGINIGAVPYDKENTNNTTYTRNSDDTFTNGDTTLTYKRFSYPLQYSDFGKIEYNDNTEKFFTGGYKELRYEAPASNIGFTGSAYGIVKNSTKQQELNGSANLSFEKTGETVKETLNMTFNTWYDVGVENIVENNNETQTISFKGKDFITPPTVELTGFDSNNEKVGAGTATLTTDIGYYGPNDANVKEATGRVNYTEGDVQMDVVFGTTKLTN